jgi:hypothetical protein
MIEINDHLLQAKIACATGNYINGIAAACPPLDWHYDRGKLTGHIPWLDYDDPESVARQWAAALGLGGGMDTGYGTREFSGSNGGLAVCIWYVSDREEFERK